MSSKVQTTGACTPTTETVVNELNTATLALIDVTGAATKTQYTTDGPFGETVTVDAVVLETTTTDAFKCPANVGNLLASSASVLRGTVWVRLHEDTDGPRDVKCLLQTRTPVVSASMRNNLMPGVWEKIYVDATDTFTTSTKIEPGITSNVSNDGAFTVEVWTNSWMVEDYSTPWTGNHPTVVAAAGAGASRVIADIQLKDFASYGDSIPAGGGTDETSNYLGNTIAKAYGVLHSVQDATGGTTSAQALTAITASTDAEKAMVTLIWTGANDVSTISPAGTVDNIVGMVDQILAVGNTHYVVFALTYRTDNGPGSTGYNRITEINNALAAHPKIKNNLLDVNAGLSADYDTYMEDVTHPNNAGYEQVIYPALKAFIDAKGWMKRREYCNWNVSSDYYVIE